ncbi:A disintegrin and metalloproteinase with thrombospondin motifs like [Patella vulgata]|uniref:A disintegrin and metalloproteinase with thrombospondin motifs like n=1 Tax=Patella vulgata TaxID=6465 RepID=UPI00217F2D5B|nr:A disintegrin and metalloproteinase with thrombospondin motifs like [Patella vulgata]
MNFIFNLILIWEILVVIQVVECGILERNVDSEAHSASVEVLGDLILHDKLRLFVDTLIQKHEIPLTRVEDEVMHDDVQGFIVSGNADGKTEIHVENLPEHVLKYNKQFFHNLDTGTILSIIHGPDGDIHVEGFLGHGLIIAPPGSQERHRRDLHSTRHTVWSEEDGDKFTDYLEVPDKFKDERMFKKSHPRRNHNVLKRSTPGKVSEFTDYLEVPEYFKNPYQLNPPHRKKRQINGVAPFIIEVFLLVDFKVFEWFKKDIAKIGTYLLHFWQAVNYKFRTMKNPNVAVKVKQYGAVQSAQFQTFIEENRIPSDATLISLKAVLDGFRKWMMKFESNVHFSTHDVAILMTGEDLCRMNGTNDCFRLTAGIGYVKGACISSREYLSSTYDVAVSEMGKSFRGVIVGAHELGHLIGAYHDGEGDALNCPKDSGFIMSYTRNNATMFTRFSECSKNSISNFVTNTWYSRCLQDTTGSGYNYPDILPGQYMDLAAQCFHYTSGGTPCMGLIDQCERLCCETPYYRFRRREPAVDGTSCGTNKVCMNGQCVFMAMG